MITPNERKILKFLMANFDRDYSINQIAKECGISPNGAFKILKKLQKEEVLVQKDIANIKSFKINYKNIKARKVLELALIEKLEGKIMFRHDDLKPLNDLTAVCVLFGSYVYKKEPGDLDLLFVLEKRNFERYKERLKSLQEVIPIKIHDLVQTKKDLESNLKAGNEVLRKAIREGMVLWGQEDLIEVFAHVCR